MATQSDVAARAGVSFITVSRVINNKGNVNEETRKRVLEAVQELKYYPNSLGRGLNMNKVNAIGFIVQTPEGVTISESKYYNEIISGIEKACTKHSIDMLITTQKEKDNNHFDYLKLYHERKIDGMVVVTPNLSNPQFDEIEESNIPCVIIGDRPDKHKISYVDSDNKGGTFILTKIVINKGHRKIGFIKGPSNNRNAMDRYLGFIEAMEEYKIPVNPNWMIDGGFSLEAGKEAFKTLFKQKEMPTVLMCVNDMTAIGVMKEANSLNVKIPAMLSLAGFDGIDSAGHTIPSLTTMRQPMPEMGFAAAEILIRKINDKNLAPVVQIFPVEFVEGESLASLA